MTPDTTDETRRPNVPASLDDRLASTTTEHVRIPANRLTFADRLEVLLEEYHDTRDRVEELEGQLADAEDTVEEQRETIEKLKQELQAADSSRFLGQ